MQRLSDGMLLYHGSHMVVDTPDLAKCAARKDFGKGFYLTTSKKQAEDVAGKIADDRTNVTITTYLLGGYGAIGSDSADKACISQLIPERLKDQYCFRTNEAFESISFLESEKIWI